MFFKELDVFIEATSKVTGKQIGWKDLRAAFKDKDLIVDNFNTHFFEPVSEEDRERGWAL